MKVSWNKTVYGCGMNNEPAATISVRIGRMIMYLFFDHTMKSLHICRIGNRNLVLAWNQGLRRNKHTRRQVATVSWLVRIDVRDSTLNTVDEAHSDFHACSEEWFRMMRLMVRAKVDALLTFQSWKDSLPAFGSMLQNPQNGPHMHRWHSQSGGLW